MTIHVRAHFDGKVLIPDEPLDVPIDKPLEVHIDIQKPEPLDVEAKRALLKKIAERAVDANLPPEALSRESIYQDD